MPERSPQNDYSEQELQQLTAINPSDIRHKAMDLLARREHSRLELKQKLQKRFDDETLIDEQIDRLADENLQSDSRFVESFVRQRGNRGYGPVRIREEARRKGLSDSEISFAFDTLDFDWCALAAEVISKKFGELPAQDIKEKARRTRFLQYRGFKTEHYRGSI